MFFHSVPKFLNIKLIFHEVTCTISLLYGKKKNSYKYSGDKRWEDISTFINTNFKNLFKREWNAAKNKKANSDFNNVWNL